MAKPKHAPQVPGAEPPQSESTDQPQTETPATVQDAGRPDISEVDPKTISKAVLTKQGWVCPG